MMPQKPSNSGPSEGEGCGSEGESEGESDGGNGIGNKQVDGNGDQLVNITSTPGSSLHSGTRSSPGLRSFMGSRAGSSPFRPPPVDTRQHYKGYRFIFATDAYHCTETVYGNENGDGIRYLKPIHRGQSMDLLPLIRLPLFFTGFDWSNVDGQHCSMSRVKLCDAWQIAFNRLLYYASFIEEKSVKLDSADVEVFKQEFAAWNDLFCELDQTLGRLVQCEIAHVLPKFKASMDLEDLTNPKNLTDPKTPFRDLNSTFLCVAREILEKHARENESPPGYIEEIETNTEGWQPCTGYSVVQATGWDCD